MPWQHAICGRHPLHIPLHIFAVDSWASKVAAAWCIVDAASQCSQHAYIAALPDGGALIADWVKWWRCTICTALG